MIVKGILVFIFCCGFCLNANGPEISEPVLWRSLYHGNYSVSHKMMLSREISTTNDAIMSQFMMAYVYYKIDQTEQMVECFKGIDRYLEHYYELDEKR